MKKVLAIALSFLLVISMSTLPALAADTNFDSIATSGGVTVGDGAEVDQIIAFDGNAQDFYVGIDDTDDDLNIGVGATPGTTPAIEVNEDATVTITVGIVKPVDIPTTDITATIIQSGTTFFFTNGTEHDITLPSAATSAGISYKVICAAAPSSDDYRILTNASENVLIGHINEVEVDDTINGSADADGDAITFADGVAIVGDSVTLECNGTSWFVTGQCYAAGGITITKLS